MKKTRWIILGLTLMISVAVYLNWWFVRDGDDVFTVAGNDECDEYEKILKEPAEGSVEE